MFGIRTLKRNQEKLRKSIWDLHAQLIEQEGKIKILNAKVEQLEYFNKNPSRFVKGQTIGDFTVDTVEVILASMTAAFLWTVALLAFFSFMKAARRHVSQSVKDALAKRKTTIIYGVVDSKGEKYFKTEEELLHITDAQKQ